MCILILHQPSLVLRVCKFVPVGDWPNRIIRSSSVYLLIHRFFNVHLEVFFTIIWYRFYIIVELWLGAHWWLISSNQDTWKEPDVCWWFKVVGLQPLKLPKTMLVSRKILSTQHVNFPLMVFYSISSELRGFSTLLSSGTGHILIVITKIWVENFPRMYWKIDEV